MKAKDPSPLLPPRKQILMHGIVPTTWGFMGPKPVCLLAPVWSRLQTDTPRPHRRKGGGSAGVGGTQGVRGPCESRGHTDLGVPGVGLAPYHQSLPWGSVTFPQRERPELQSARPGAPAA